MHPIVPIKQEYLIIVNPNAGKGKGGKDWRMISEYLAKYEFRYISRFTKAIGHAINLTVEGIQEGYRKNSQSLGRVTLFSNISYFVRVLCEVSI